MKFRDLTESEKQGFEVPEVVSSQYIVSQTLQLTVLRSKVWSCCSELTIENDHAQRPFTVENSGWGSILLLDSMGNELVFLERQILAWKDSWKVYLGDKGDKENLLFTFRQIDRKSFRVFLASNGKGEKPDFTVKKDRTRERSFDVFHHSITKPIAEAKVPKDESNLKVTVYPGIDLAFVATLIVLMDHVHGGNKMWCGAG